MAADRSSAVSAFPWANLTLVVLFAIGVIVPTFQLESLRPSESGTSKHRFVGIQDVPARLWQDPFDAAVLHRDDATLSHLKEPVLEKGVLALRTSHAPARLRALVAQELAQHCRVTVLGVMVPGGPYAEYAELRRRHRYAALSALGALGYSPDDPEHVGYIVPPPDLKFRWIPRIVPFEWLSPALLVLWIEEDAFTTNPSALDDIQTILDMVHPGYLPACAKRSTGERSTLDYKIIGPSSSVTLTQMIGKAKPKSGQDVEYYVATATARMVGQSKSQAAQPAGQPAGFDPLRTILTDNQLAAALVEELARREIHPGVARDSDGDTDHMVLLSEWDTYYGQQLPLEVIEAARARCVQSVGPDAAGCKDADPPWVLRYSYLRGLDGRTPASPKSAADASKQSQPRQETRDARPVERADGNHQYDYLRRIGAELRRRNDELRREGKGEIKAVGVLGSDAYDKLQVLQAIRNVLPKAVFFTTDLDGRFLHADRLAWSRNLVVASSFGLSLNPGLQHGTPPFRDGYQTSVFLATMVALQPAQYEAKRRWLKGWLTSPRLFEIGRTGALDITPASAAAPGCTRETFDKCTQVHPARTIENPITRWNLFTITSLALAGVLLLALCSWRAKDWLKQYWGRLALGYLVALGIWWLLVRFVMSDPGQEPFAWLEGLSVWPSTLIRLLALALAAMLVACAAHVLAENTRLINERFFPGLSLVETRSDDEASSWRRSKDSKQPVQARKLWQEYLFRTQWRRVFWRVTLMTILFMVISFFLVSTDAPGTPCRGDLSCGIARSVLYASVLAFVWLLFFVVLHIHLCHRLVQVLYSGRSDWPKESYEALRTTADAGREWLDIQLVAARTEAIGTLIYYPFFVLLLLIVARSSLFDNWHLPTGLALVFVLSFLFTAINAVMLDRAAEHARSIAERRLTEFRLECILAGNDGRGAREHCEALLGEIRQIRSGAFRPLLQQPLVQAILIPLGGYGGISLIEFLTPFR